MGREFRACVVVWMILVVLLVARISANEEANALYSQKISLQDPYDVLQGWGATLENPCLWLHVTCNIENSVVRIDLENAFLSGQLAPQLGLLTNLQNLELSGNNISGQIPSELGNLTNLVSLDLYLNSFTGLIPDTLGKLTKLRFPRLNNNSLSGSIPMSLSTLAALDVSNNYLSGPVPNNGSFSYFYPVSFANNLDLCGPLIGKPCPGSPPSTVATPDDKLIGAIVGGVVAGAALLIAAPAIGFVYWWRQKKPHNHSFDARELQYTSKADQFCVENSHGMG